MKDKFGNEALIIPEEGEEELWLPAPGYQDKYEISNFGRVRRKETQYIRKLGNDNNGYPVITLRKKDSPTDINKIHYVYIHRLVCEAFNGPPFEEFNVCDHIDRCIINNYYKNLRWTDYRGNKENSKQPKKEKITVDKTPIVFLDLEGNFKQRFNSIQEAHDILGLSIIQIQHNLRGQRRPFKNGYFRTEAQFLTK